VSRSAAVGESCNRCGGGRESKYDGEEPRLRRGSGVHSPKMRRLYCGRSSETKPWRQDTRVRPNKREPEGVAIKGTVRVQYRDSENSGRMQRGETKS
jgi:hypothetical protein